MALVSKLIINELSMLSPYISMCYILCVLCKFEFMTILLTPITWIICIIGLLLVFYKRFFQKKILRSYIIFKIFRINSDIPLIIFKLSIILLLIYKNNSFTLLSIIIALLILPTYILLIDVKETYDL